MTAPQISDDAEMLAELLCLSLHVDPHELGGVVQFVTNAAVRNPSDAIIAFALLPREQQLDAVHQFRKVVVVR